MKKRELGEEIVSNSIYIEKCEKIVHTLEELDQLLQSYISLNNINAIKEITEFIELQLEKQNINKFILETNTLNEVEYNYFKSMRRLVESKTYRICQYMYAVNNIYIQFFRIHLIENKMDKYLLKLNSEVEYNEWIVFFRKDIMQQLTELFFSTKFEYTYSLDSLIRGLRVIEENIMFVLLILECPRKMWNPDIIIRLYDHRRNLSRLSFSPKEGEIIFHNGAPKGREEYITTMELQGKEFNQYYKKEFNKLRKIGEQKLKKELNLNNGEIKRIKLILANKNKQKRREQLYQVIVHEKGIKYSNSFSKNEFLNSMEKKLEFLIYSFPIPNNIYIHIKNVFVANGIIYKGDVSTIKGFHQYMKDYSTTNLITKLDSDIEMNLSSHIMLDGMRFDEISVLLNKTEPVKCFISKLDENIIEYYTLILSVFTTDKEKKKMLEILEGVS